MTPYDLHFVSIVDEINFLIMVTVILLYKECLVLECFLVVVAVMVLSEKYFMLKGSHLEVYLHYHVIIT